MTINPYSYRPISLLPNIYEDELHSLDIANGVRMASLANEFGVIHTLWNPRTCPEIFLSELAKSYGADFFYVGDTTLEQKREIVWNALQLNRKKGTPWAVEQVGTLMGRESEVLEWFDYNGIPYHFKLSLTLNQQGADATFLMLYEKFVEKYKNARSILDLISLRCETKGSLYLGSMVSVAEVFRIEPYFRESVETVFILTIGLASSMVEKTTILPKGEQ